MYRAVVKGEQTPLRATALVGMHSILLGFDYDVPPAQRADLLGFAIHRTDKTSDESWWLSGQIRFKGDAGDFGEDVPTNRAPLQKFHWGDYTAKPGHEYVYRVHAVHGSPGSPQLSTPVELAVQAAVNRAPAIGVHFNRGVTAARAYRLRFGDKPPDEVEDDAAYRWLSRGLQEALLSYLAAAKAGDELKVAIYEFEHESVIEALKSAKARGVSVRLVYHARPGDEQGDVNSGHVAELALPPAAVKARTRVPNISHNKLVVLLRDGKPIRVWTGSTNFTEAGFFLQTNVGLTFSDAKTAQAYDAYFELLFRDLAKSAMHKAVEALTASLPASDSSALIFAPEGGTTILKRSVQLVADAKQAVFISCPFGLDAVVANALNANGPAVLEYGLVNTTSRKRIVELIDRSPNSWFTTPNWLKEFDGGLWDAHAYGNHKVHVKSIVIDPWSTGTEVLIGSANFSDESARLNDENSLYKRGDRRLAAIVATEFLRMFDHYKFRDYVVRAKKSTAERYLVEDGSWTKPYFDPATSKFTERRVFAQS